MVGEPLVALTRLIDTLNERFVTDFNGADQLFFDQMVEAAAVDSRLQQAAMANPGDAFELVFRTLLETLFVERIDQNEAIFARYMNDAAFRAAITAELARSVYRKLRAVAPESTGE